MSNILTLDNKPFIDTRGRGYYDVIPELHGQINVSELQPGLVRGFHFHKLQTDHVFCSNGNMHVILIEPLAGYEFETLGKYHIGENDSVRTNSNDFGFNADAAIGGSDGVDYIRGKVRHYYIGEHNPQTIIIPPGVIHGYKALYNRPVTMVYYANRKFDVMDEYRFSWDFLGADLWESKNA